MRADKSTALQIKDIFTLCLADAIEQAMLDMAGPHWFAAFAEYDASPECKTPILRPNQASIHDCDMQALLKILRYREPYAEAILEYYGFFDPNDEYGNSIKKGHFQHLLNRLITDFRNRMEAHTRAADLKDKKDGMLYDYGDAVNDMLKLADIFRNVKNKNGMSYHKQMTLIANKKRRKQAYILLAVVGILVASCVGLCIWLLSQPPQTTQTSSDGDQDSAPAITGILSMSGNGNKITSRADGGFTLKCQLTNVTPNTLTDIQVANLVVMCDGKAIAKKRFLILTDQNGDTPVNLTLSPGETVPYTFVFEKTDMIIPDASTKGPIVCSFECDARKN